MDEERIGVLEQMLKEMSDAAYESDKKSDEVRSIVYQVYTVLCNA